MDANVLLSPTAQLKMEYVQTKQPPTHKHTILTYNNTFFPE